jgi:hypothetical protein
MAAPQDQNDLIDTLLAQGMTPAQIADYLVKQGATATGPAGASNPLDTAGAASTSGLSDIYTQQLQDQKDQQQLDNLLALLKLDQGDQPDTPQVLADRGRDLVGSFGQDFGGSNEFALSSLNERMGNALNYDAIMRQRNQRALDQNPPMMSSPQAQNPLISGDLRGLIMQRLLEKLGIGGAAPPNQVDGGGRLTAPAGPPARSPEAVQQTGQTIPSPAVPTFYNPMDMQEIIRNRLMGANG